jgi:hypothetical protein
MAWVAVDLDGSEYVYEYKPIRFDDCTWDCSIVCSEYAELPKGTIKRAVSRELTWEDEPVELK